MANQLSRRFSNGLQFQGSYTWSHNIDNSTDGLSSTALAPRRPMDSQNLRIERASSLLDYRNRIVLQMIYDVPYLKNRNWWLKNIIRNWENCADLHLSIGPAHNSAECSGFQSEW
jgi:hypothetical protein